MKIYLLKTDGTKTPLTESIKKDIKKAAKLIGCESIDYMIFNKFTIWWDDFGRVNGSERNIEAEKMIAEDPMNNKYLVFGNVIVFSND